MKIYTKTGDQGTTGLFGGKRVSKSNIRIDTYGTVDELNSWIGLLRDLEINKNRVDVLIEIQDRLFTTGSILATEPNNSKVKIPDLVDADIQLLEKEIDRMDSELEPMKSFILPGGHQSVSYCHIARTVCRRAERLTVQLQEEEPINTMVIKYLNRLSDYLFVLSRQMGKDLAIQETPWKPRM
jgi:cob(I)alamin adenosyltransferase